MSKNREIEAKTLLAKSMFDEIKKAFPKKVTFKQANYYFDSIPQTLKKHEISCRIRIFADHAEQTLKVPDKNPVQNKFHEVIEINDPLSVEKAQQLIKTVKKQGYLNFSGNVGHYLKQNLPQLTDHLELFTWSKTERSLLTGPKACELTLDQTVYPDGYIDYELEIENPDPQLIQQVHHQLSQTYHFKNTSQNTNMSKIGRASLHRK